MTPLPFGAAAAVIALLSLLLGVPASADTATPVEECPPGDRSYSSVGASSVTATAPEGYRITSFCVVGRGNAGPEVHTLSAPQRTTVVTHSTGKQLVSYSVTYAQVPVASVPEAPEKTVAAKPSAKAEPTPAPRDAEPEPRDTEPEPSPPAPAAEKTVAPAESTPLSSLMSDGEDLQVTRFEERGDREDRWSLLVVGGIIVVGLLAGAIALLVRIPGQR